MTRASINDRQGRCEEPAEEGALLALAERCEKATGPDRELDAAIASEVFKYNCRNPIWECGPVSAYTTSLDAAMSLVQEGCQWRVDSHNNIAGVFDYPTDPESGPYCREYEGEGFTPALALCAAALRARAQSGAAS